MTKQLSKFTQPGRDLISKCKNGDTGAFKDIMDMTRDLAYNVAVNILLNEEDARDALQESYIKVWKNIRSFRENRLFTTWLYTIVTNNSIDMLRKRQQFSENAHVQVYEAFESESDLINKDRIKLIKKLSKALPHTQRMVFILVDLQGLAANEVSEILKMSKGSIKSNLYYARKTLKVRLFKMENWGM